MNPSRLPYSAPGQLLTSLLGALMILGPAGCTSFLSNFSPTTGGGDGFGILVNTKTSSNTLGALRLVTGESVFLFGSFDANGLIREISSALLVDEQGREAGVVFDNGLIKKATSYDGSTIDFTYDEVSTKRLTGHVDLFFAGVPEADQNQTVEFDVDLEQAAAELAALVQDLLGLDVSSEEPPENPLAKGRRPDIAAADFGKDAASAQLIAIFFLEFHVTAFAFIGFAMVQVMAHVVKAMMNLLVKIVPIITRTLIVAFTTPFIVMGDLLRVAVIQPRIAVDFDIDINFSVPDKPD